MRRKISTNRQALRWCQNRMAKVSFNKTGCHVHLGRRSASGSTLIKTINKHIDIMNNKDICDESE